MEAYIALSLMETLQFWVAVAGLMTTLSIAWIKCKMNMRMQKAWDVTFGRTQVQLDLILSEVRPNSGGSMKDAVGRIEKRQEEFMALTNARMNADDRAIFLTDVKGKVYWNNRCHQQMTGFTVDRIRGSGWINVIHPEDRERVHKKWQQAIDEHREFSEDIKYINISGEPYMVHVEAHMQLDSNSKVTGYLGIVTKIAEDM